MSVQAPARHRQARRAADIPAEVRQVLRSIVADMRDVPRDIIHDPAELFIWLRRMAARVEGVERIRVPEPDPVRLGSTPRPQISPVGGFIGLVRYPGSAAGAKSPPVARKSSLGTITSRKGKPIPVEIRRKP